MLTAIKEIKRIKNHKLTVSIPDDFGYDKVEVLILPFEEPFQNTTKVDNKRLIDDVFDDAKTTTISKNINIDEIMKDMNNTLS